MSLRSLGHRLDKIGERIESESQRTRRMGPSTPEQVEAMRERLLAEILKSKEAALERRREGRPLDAAKASMMDLVGEMRSYDGRSSEIPEDLLDEVEARLRRMGAGHNKSRCVYFGALLGLPRDELVSLGYLTPAPEPLTNGDQQ